MTKIVDVKKVSTRETKTGVSHYVCLNKDIIKEMEIKKGDSMIIELNNNTLKIRKV